MQIYSRISKERIKNGEYRVLCNDGNEYLFVTVWAFAKRYGKHQEVDTAAIARELVIAGENSIQVKPDFGWNDPVHGFHCETLREYFIANKIINKFSEVK